MDATDVHPVSSDTPNRPMPTFLCAISGVLIVWLVEHRASNRSNSSLHWRDQNWLMEHFANQISGLFLIRVHTIVRLLQGLAWVVAE